MKALLITPETQTIDMIEIDGQEDIVKLIGFDTITSDEVGSEGDQLYFDEECFLRGTEGRFQVDNLIPVSGKGIVIGSEEDGSLGNVTMNKDELAARIKYL
jgi:hypothetical protein